MTLAELISEQARLDWVTTDESQIRQATMDSAKRLKLNVRVNRIEIDLKPDGWHIILRDLDTKRLFNVSFALPVYAVDKEWYMNEIVRQLEEQLK